MIEFNYAGVLILVFGFGVALVLGVLSRSATSWPIVVMGLAWIGLDVAYRLSYPNYSWFAPSRGGQIYYIPMWMFGLWAIAAAIIAARDAKKRRDALLTQSFARGENPWQCGPRDLIVSVRFADDTNGRRIEASVANYALVDIVIESVDLVIGASIGEGESCVSTQGVALRFDSAGQFTLASGDSQLFVLSQESARRLYLLWDRLDEELALLVRLGSESPCSLYVPELRDVVRGFVERQREVWAGLHLKPGIAVPRSRSELPVVHPELE